MEISFLVLGVLALTSLAQGQDQSGFLSLDCGLPADASYSDPKTASIIFQMHHSLTVVYPDDVYDRLWHPFHLIQLTDISTNLTVDFGSHNDYQPPSIVMRSAVTQANSSNPLLVSIGDSVEYKTYQFYVYMHFAEIEKLEANQSRKFNISLNGTFWAGPIIPLYLYTITEYSDQPSLEETMIFLSSKLVGQPCLPFSMQLKFITWLSSCNQKLAKLISTYGITRNWQGDPCAPQDYVWDGLSCSYNGTAPPIITSLNLSSSGLTGEIASDIANLKSLKSLDLSNNSLTGPVPDFLSQLASLKVLNMTGNRLTGTVPVDLLKRSQSGLLLLRICASDSCNDNKNKKYVVPVTVSVAALFVIVAAILLAICLKRRKKQAAGQASFESSSQNLTSLVGYCEEANHLVLIYEYMANGDLKHHLSGLRVNVVDDPADILSWEGRLRIALGAAQGLEYLHNGCKPPIVHRDVKTTNILLDDKFQAKLADFGLSRNFAAEGDSHVTTTVAGTPGYLDPEYHVTNWLTEKSDVYSFGVVLLEIITSRPVIAKTADKIHLSTWVSSMLDKGDIKAIADPRLNVDFDINSLWKVTELAMACVSETSAERPTMSQVVMELNECLATEMARTRRGVVHHIILLNI
ncbi:hypothetical protein GH714_035852 [Hevea brasiliensis]|uniref:non-specific serine/threonine protein kinase n=1 Tax=Hevea brasiliensis TaxID=3981 RepID=A0A6A6NBF9_HEVBR|nr:hypothetical protein GH714_035852 [Hevea brasiliensis]